MNSFKELADHLDNNAASRDEALHGRLQRIEDGIYGTPASPGLRERVGVLEDRSRNIVKGLWIAFAAILAKWGIDLPWTS